MHVQDRIREAPAGASRAPGPQPDTDPTIRPRGDGRRAGVAGHILGAGRGARLGGTLFGAYRYFSRAIFPAPPASR